MTTIRNSLYSPAGTAIVDAYVAITLMAVTAFNDVGTELVSSVVMRTDEVGNWSVDLIPNSEISPANTIYRVLQKMSGQDYVAYFTVPVSGGPYNLQDVLTVAPVDLPTVPDITAIEALLALSLPVRFTKTIDSDQASSLLSSPVQVIPAPPEDYFYVPITVVLHTDPGSVGYSAPLTPELVYSAALPLVGSDGVFAIAPFTALAAGNAGQVMNLFPILSTLHPAYVNSSILFTLNADLPYDGTLTVTVICLLSPTVE